MAPYVHSVKRSFCHDKISATSMICGLIHNTHEWYAKEIWKPLTSDIFPYKHIVELDKIHIGSKNIVFKSNGREDEHVDPLFIKIFVCR